MLKEYTKELSRRGLLEEETTGSFITTEKGRAFLKFYERIKDMLSDHESSTDQMDFGAKIIPSGGKLLALGISKKFLQGVRISEEQERDLVKGILYLRERANDLSEGN